MEEKMQLLKVRRFGDVINDTLGFVKLTFKPLGTVILLLVLPLLILGCYFFANFFAEMMSASMQGRTQWLESRAGSAMASMALGYLGLLIAGVCHNLAIMQTVLKYEASETGQIQASDIFSGIKENLLRFIGYIFGVGVLGGLAMVVVIGIFVAIAAISAGFAILIMLVLYVGIIYVAVTMSFSPFIYMRERSGIINSVGRSFKLIKGSWWQTFGVMLVAYFIVSFASMIFVIPFYAMFFVSMLHSVSGGGAPTFEFSIWSKLAFGFMMCGTTLLSSFIYVAIIMQYYSLVERKEGENIMQQIENIGSPETPST